MNNFVSNCICTAQNCLLLDNLIKLQEGILADKVYTGQYSVGNFLTDGHFDPHHQ